MPVGNFNGFKTTYYSIDKETGKIKLKNKDAKSVELFQYIDGVLIDVQKEKSVYEGVESEKLRFTFSVDGSIDGEREVLQCGWASMFGRDILNCLDSLDIIGKVRFTPFMSEYEVNGLKKVSNHGALRAGKNLDKVAKKYKDEIPAVEKVKVGNKEYDDTSKRDEFFEKVLASVQSKLVFKQHTSDLVEDEEAAENKQVPF